MDSPIKISKISSDRIEQGDIYRDVEFLQKIDPIDNEISVHIINFPLVIVLTQDCDLQQDSIYYMEEDTSNDDKKILSIIVAPLYNAEMFLNGEHLNDPSIDYKMRIINKKKKGKITTDYNNLINNDIPRYHHLSFEENANIVNSVIDFKHYFTVTSEYLYKNKNEKFLCKVNELFRERITQRFANFLARIGLPGPD